MNYRIIALDLDGTLLTSQKTILSESLDAIKAARAAGITVLLVTGRHHVAIRPFYHALALDTPAICCNGTYSYDFQAQKVLAATPLAREQAQSTIRLLEQNQINGLMYVEDAMVYQTASGHVTRSLNWAQSLPPEQRPVYRQVSSLYQAAAEDKAIWKFALTDPSIDRLNEVTALIEQELGLACEWSWIDQVDVAQAGNSKGKRLAEWVAGQGYSMDEVIAFGDNYNDISMLELAGMGVAMGNADDAVKAHADRVIGLNSEPVIAQTIRELVL
ncbi:pyridoxal phosphatase [Salmonella enterica subsp. enterica serovar Choleraesuis]|nr:pyridoxal phosphatase [Salmonella enterica subsp. enterica serovar Choleraesuis]